MTDLNQLKSIFSQADFLKEQLNQITELEEKITENEITISVMGQFKRGKSSLINHMLKTNLLPTAIIPITTIITEIRYAKTHQAKICYLDGREEDIDISQIENFCSEEHNPSNIKKVKFLRLWTPNHPFKSGVVLADTPGVGSVNDDNTFSAYNYIKRSDVILFLLSVDSPVSEIERDFLLEGKEFAQKFFFAINKTDLISLDDLKKFKNYCTDTISMYLDKDISIYPISTKTGDGVDLLENIIDKELQENHSTYLENSILHKVSVIKSQAVSKLKLQIEAASMPSDELKKKLLSVEEKQKQSGNFANSLSAYSNHLVDNLIEDIKKLIDNECDKISDNLKPYGNELFDEYSSLKPKQFEKKFSSEINLFLREELNKINNLGLKYLFDGYEDISTKLKDETTKVSVFLRKLMLEELGVDYQVKEMEFKVSNKNDFLLHIGLYTPLIPDLNSLNTILPKKIANKNFYHRAMEQAENDIIRNKNNIIYNYKYKMQESLRSLCSTLNEENTILEAELESLKRQITLTLSMAKTKKDEETKASITLLEKLQ